jgi:hypothetical protein
MSFLSIAGKRSPDKMEYTFTLPNFGDAANVKCFTNVRNVKSCHIEYDSKEKIDIPVPLLMWMYNIGKNKFGFTLPIRWDFLKTCEITIGFECKPLTPPEMQYFPHSDELVPMFRSTAVFPLGRELLIDMQSHAADKAVLVFQSCGNTDVVNVCTRQKYDTAHDDAFEIEVHHFLWKTQLFTTSEVGKGTCQIFSYEKYHLQVETSSKREVALVFDEYKPSPENFELGTAMSQWKGQTLIYHWSPDHLALMERARSLTHVELPRALTPVQRAQMACILGLCLEDLDRLMLDKTSLVKITQ